MIKWLLFLAVCGFVYLVIRSRFSPPSKAVPPQRPALSMMPCEVCGLNVPENEAIRVGDKAFCSHPHYQQWQSKQ